MKPLSGTHASVDDYQLERRDIGLNENTETRQHYVMPSKREPGYGNHTITLEEWREVYGS